MRTIRIHSSNRLLLRHRQQTLSQQHLRHNQQQPAQQNQQQPQANAVDVEKIQKANQFLESVKNNIKENKIYWAIATDFVKEIQNNIPDFKADNQAAKPGIDAWEAFKKEPGEATFNTFMDALSAFAAPQQPEQQTSEQAQQA